MNKINCLSLPSHDVSQSMADTKVIQKKILRIRKECYHPYDFCRVADFVSQTNHTCITCSTYVFSAPY